MAVLRAAIDEGIASGVAEPGVFSRVREKHGLPARLTDWSACLASAPVASDGFMESVEDLPEALASVKQGLSESAEGKSVYRGSFAKHAKELRCSGRSNSRRRRTRGCRRWKTHLCRLRFSGRFGKLSAIWKLILTFMDFRRMSSPH